MTAWRPAPQCGPRSQPYASAARERIVVAVPVGAPETCEEIRSEADDVVCARTPEPFDAVGLWYGDFSQTTDEEVQDLLVRAAEEPAPVHHGGP